MVLLTSSQAVVAKDVVRGFQLAYLSAASAKDPERSRALHGMTVVEHFVAWLDDFEHPDVVKYHHKRWQKDRLYVVDQTAFTFRKGGIEWLSGLHSSRVQYRRSDRRHAEINRTQDYQPPIPGLEYLVDRGEAESLRVNRFLTFVHVGGWTGLEQVWCGERISARGWLYEERLYPQTDGATFQGPTPPGRAIQPFGSWDQVEPPTLQLLRPDGEPWGTVGDEDEDVA